MKVDIDSRDLQTFKALFARLPEIADHAAQLAINDTARFARREGVRHVMEEVNYKKSYLGGEDGRLGVTRFATRGKLEAVVSGRDRATSLARFAVSPVRFGRQKGIKVEVSARHGAETLKRAFYMRLRRGKSFDPENANVGLAVRLGKGETLSNSRAALDIGGGVYLLYGPSVDQVFKGVAADIVDDVSDHLEEQFIRQFERLAS
jgi:hypothetical protein